MVMKAEEFIFDLHLSVLELESGDTPLHTYIGVPVY
jgi:hypothetical protein